MRLYITHKQNKKKVKHQVIRYMYVVEGRLPTLTFSKLNVVPH